MRMAIGSGLFIAALCLGALSFAQTMQPGTNTPLMGCIEGRALRIVNGYPACSTTVAPILSSCGSGAALSANATDFVGQITTGASVVSGCMVTFSKLYANLGCLAQSNSSASAVAGSPVMGVAGGKTTMTINLTLALSAGKVTYSCFPV